MLPSGHMRDLLGDPCALLQEAALRLGEMARAGEVA
jgi:hypothetical protein